MRRALLAAAALVLAATPATAAPQGEAVPAGPDGTAARIVTVVTEGDPAPSQLVVTGDDVRPVAATGVRTGSAAGATARVAPSRTPAVHQVYVAPVAPAGTSVQGLPAGATVDRLVAEAGAYWAGQTGGRVRFAVARRLPAYASAYGCGEFAELWQEARSAFDRATGTAGVTDGANRHLLLALPPSAMARGCAAGLASIGTSVGSGGVLYASEHAAPVYAHELGHNLGLSHAGSLLCTTRRDSALGAGGRPAADGCRRHEYDDYLEVMSSYGGRRGTGNLNVAHLADLGLEPQLVRTIAPMTSRVLTLAPLSDRSGAVRGVQARDGGRDAYFVQYRIATGIDAGGPAGYRWGVEVHREDPAAPGAGGSLMLDMSATGGQAGRDLSRSLPVGATFTSASGRVAVTVLGQRATGATVRVTSGIAPRGVAARVSASAARAGRRVQVTGVVRDVEGRFVPRQAVRLQRRDAAGRWRAAGNGVTDAHGRVVVTSRARGSAYVRLVVPEAATHPAVRGGRVRVA